MTEERQYKRVVSAGALTVELAAVLGEHLESIAVRGDAVTVYIRGGATPEQLEAVDRAVEQHDPTTKTEGQLREENSQEAKTELGAVDFASLVTRIEEANSIALLRDALLDVVKLCYQSAAAQGLVVEKLPPVRKGGK